MCETFDEILKEQTEYYISKDTNIEEIFGEDSIYADLFEFVENNADDPEIVNPNDHPYLIYTYIYRHKETGRYVFVQKDVQMEYSHSEIIDIREVKKEVKTVEVENWV
jgi:hypothetical protein